MFIDSHCHLNLLCFDELLLSDLKQKEVHKVIIPATQKSSWGDIQSLCLDHRHLYYALGIHPHYIESFHDEDLQALVEMLINKDEKCVAVGEIGLDKNSSTDLLLQEKIFIEQLQIAKRFELPVILHIVKCQARVLEILKKEKFSFGGVYHAFSGSEEIALEFIKLGFKLGIGGVITYPGSTKTRDVVSRLPIDSLLLETDAPDMPLYQQQEKHNSPSNILPIFNALSQLRRESKSELASQLYQNTCRIFSLK